MVGRCQSVRHMRSLRTGQGQGRAGQGRAGQGRAGQGRAGQGRAGQVRAGQGRAGQGRAGQGRAGQGRAGQGRAGLGRAGLGSTGQMGRRHKEKKTDTKKSYQCSCFVTAWHGGITNTYLSCISPHDSLDTPCIHLL